jgi:hypothetical protein
MFQFLYIMNKLFSIFAVSVLFFSCGTKKPIEVPAPAIADVIVKMEHTTQGKSFEGDTIKYTNEAGNQYSTRILKYYMSNVKMIKADGSEVVLGTYNLVDAFSNTKNQFTLKGVPNGSYTAIKFLLGVDYTNNHTGLLEGDLDPGLGMIWSWNTGYVFLKHEGRFIDNAGVQQSFAYHYATDKAAVEVTIPLTLKTEFLAKKVTLNLDIDQLYNTPMYNFNTDRFVHSDEGLDKDWIANIKSNVPSAFSLVGVQ